MYNNKGDPFIATLQNVILSPDLCDRLFSIIKLRNLGHTCLFQKGVFTVNSVAKEKKLVTTPHSAQRKYAFLQEVKGISKTKKLPSRNKIALEILYQGLGHRSTRSLLAGYTSNCW